MKKRQMNIALGLAWMLAVAAGAQAGDMTITIREQLGRGWTNEWVSYPFQAPEGACATNSLSLRGPDGPMPVQLSNVETWPGTPFVKAARVHFIVKRLDPLASHSYTLSYSKEPARAIPSDLEIVRDRNTAQITTQWGGLRIPLGDHAFGKPLPFSNLPAPLQFIRLGKGGAWAGRVRFAGEGAATNWTSTLVDAGPVFARTRSTWRLEGGGSVELDATLAAGDNTTRWDLRVNGMDLTNAWLEFRLPPVPGATSAVSLKGYGQWAKADRPLPLAAGDTPFAWLSPDSSVINIFPENACSMSLAARGEERLRISSRDPAAWVDPVAPFTYGGFTAWNLDMIDKSWANWKRKRMPITYSADGTVELRATLVPGARKWSIGSGRPDVADRLDRVKDMVLDWPADPSAPHPRLFVDKGDIEALWARAAGDSELEKALAPKTDAAGILGLLRKPADQRKPAEVDAALKVVRNFLALEGNFDVMRHAIRTAAMYDAAVDSGLLSPEERALFRARMAYLGYQLADPQTWDPERGYHSGNPNMSCSYILSLGVAAAALRDHPMAKGWAAAANGWMEKWLANEVGPDGEWLPEGSHYGYVSLEPLVVYAIVAKRAGFADFTADPRLKKLLLYFATALTPPDPQRGTNRVSSAYGRGTSGDRNPVFGVAARMTAGSDPAFSKTMQWFWAQQGHPVFMSDGRLGGFEPYYLDRRLPAQEPMRGTRIFANLGTFFRGGFGTPRESFLLFLSHTDARRNLDVWTPEIGGLAQWYGRGVPLSTVFTTDTGYNVRHELLRNGVRLARNWGEPQDPKGPFGHYTVPGPREAALQACADYVRSTVIHAGVDDRDWFPAVAPPAYPRVTPATGTNLTWTRQVLFVKAEAAGAGDYLVVRDTVRGGQPTAWQFWTLSEKIGTPEQVVDAAAYLADKPGATLQPARELPGGNRYTALGQFGMDVEYFIASPADTPRHTLRYGGADYRKVPEYQDLLHLQLKGDGAYYTALYPRPRGEAAPAFESLAGGAIIQVAGAFGTDYAFLSDAGAEASVEGVSFSGTSGMARKRGGSWLLTLGAAGAVKAEGLGVRAPFAVTLMTAGQGLNIALPEGCPGGEVVIEGRDNLKLLKPSPGLTLESRDKTLVLTVPSGRGFVNLSR